MNSKYNWEKFLKDRVATKYYIENDKGNIIDSYRWQVFKFTR